MAGGRRQEGPIPTDKPFSRATRRRFDKLIRLAEESPYPGEQANARAAARRLAANHGMSLDEAIGAGRELESPPSLRPEYEVDRGAGRSRPHRTYWDGSYYGDMEDSPAAEALREYARMRRDEREDRKAQERGELVWIVIVCCGGLYAIGQLLSLLQLF